MITKFKAENYGCLKNIEVDLTPVHAFIGPNDSGKSTLLHAVRTLVQFAGGRFERIDKAPGTVQAGPFMGRLIGEPDGPDAQAWVPFDPRLQSQGAGAAVFLGGFTEAGWYSIQAKADETEEGCQDAASGEEAEVAPRVWDQRSSFLRPEFHRLHPVLSSLSLARLVRLDPDALRKQSGLVPAEKLDQLGFLNERGYGLPSVLYGLRERDPDAFNGLIDTLRQLFPTLKMLRLPAATAASLTLEAELTDGTRVRPDTMSEGLLLCIALTALRHLSPCSVLLVEEPENGLHPARVAEAVRVLRDIATTTTTQVLISTHSPLVIDALTADEVTVLIRPSVEEGTRAIPIKSTRNFENRSNTYSLGELWLAYSDGNQEEPLFSPRLR